MPDLSLLTSDLVRVEAELSSIDLTPAGEGRLDKAQRIVEGGLRAQRACADGHGPGSVRPHAGHAEAGRHRITRAGTHRVIAGRQVTPGLPPVMAVATYELRTTGVSRRCS